ncbi:MAG: GNAT family N-acetyltransferase [Nanohaloarchaea archaeon]|nr:GNAT family N-acetyltransferase [Candidatus Nanohaloarchaea archaeon]
MKLKIRLGKQSDKKDYILTQKEAFPFFDSIRDKKVFDIKLQRNEIFIAESEGIYTGHLIFSDYRILPPFTGSVFIESIAVKKTFQGKGIGTALIEHLMTYCKKKKIPIIHLGTSDKEDNKAIAFYKRQGFRKVGFLEDINPESEYDCNQLFYAIEVNRWKMPIKKEK